MHRNLKPLAMIPVPLSMPFLWSWHALCTAGYIVLDIWLWHLFHDFGVQHRSTDRFYGIIAFIVFVSAILQHGFSLILILDVHRSSPSEKRGKLQTWPWVLVPFSTSLWNNTVLIFYFSKWFRQFQASGETRNASYCIACIVAAAVELLWRCTEFAYAIMDVCVYCGRRPVVGWEDSKLRGRSKRM